MSGEPGYQNWTTEKLRRKRDQAWDMAGLARCDGDGPDEARRTKEARERARVSKEKPKPKPRPEPPFDIPVPIVV